MEYVCYIIQNSGWGENSTKHPEATRPSNSEPIHKSIDSLLTTGFNRGKKKIADSINPSSHRSRGAHCCAIQWYPQGTKEQFPFEHSPLHHCHEWHSWTRPAQKKQIRCGNTCLSTCPLSQWWQFWVLIYWQLDLAEKKPHLLTSMQKSPRMVPGSDWAGFVAPMILRPVATTPFPCHTIATTGPEMMYSTSAPKKGLLDRSE